MDDVIRLLVVLVAGNALLVPFIVCLAAFFPRRLARARALADAMPGRAFVIGLVNFVFFGALGLGVSALADALSFELIRLPALAVLAVLGVAVSFGLAAVAQLLGERLQPEASPLRRLTWGTLALSLGSTFPLLGWLVLLPYAGLLGLGAFILSFFVREK